MPVSEELRAYNAAYYVAHGPQKRAVDRAHYLAHSNCPASPRSTGIVKCHKGTTSDELEVARLAGFFDADGSLGLYKPQYVLSMSVGGIHQESIRKFETRWGGTVCRSTRLGKRAYWKWEATGIKAKVALGQMLPYLCVKREQAFEACKTPLRDGYSIPNGEAPLRQIAAIRRTLGERIMALKAGVV